MRRRALGGTGRLNRLSELAELCPSALDDFESFLVLLFLRRYVTYCAQRARFARVNGRLSDTGPSLPWRATSPSIFDAKRK